MHKPHALFRQEKQDDPWCRIVTVTETPYDFFDHPLTRAEEGVRHTQQWVRKHVAFHREAFDDDYISDPGLACITS